MGPGGIAIIPTAPEQQRNRDSNFLYRPDSYFYYLSGFTEPKAWLVITSEGHTTLFCQPKDLEREIWELLANIEKRGGALECVNNGYFVNEISENSYKLTMAIESGEKKVVGVNAFQSESAPFKPFEINPKSESEQVASLKAVRAKRDNKAVTAALENLLTVAKAGDNVVPATVEAIKAYATVGEIVNELRKVYGKWQPTKIF
jgi:methylmalonyl-CoA mutase N-terminal domain/subunit